MRQRYAAACALLLTAALTLWPGAPARAAAATAPATPAPTGTDPGAALQAAAEQVLPSVVGIAVTYSPHPATGAPRHWSSTGTVLQEGVVVTTAHPLQGARAVHLLLPDGRRLEVAVQSILADPIADIAVIRVEGLNLPPAAFAPTHDLRRGEPAIAIGNPLGAKLAGSVHVGVISGLDRKLGGIYPYIQTDAVVNPGDTGGPLVGGHGQVLGITTAKWVEYGVERTAFAIPSEVVLQVATALLEGTAPQRPWLGIWLQESGPAQAGIPLSAAERQRAPGLYVTWVDAGSPLAGQVLPGDELLYLGGQRITSLDDYAAALVALKPGHPASLVVRRQEREREMQFRPAAWLGLAYQEPEFSFATHLNPAQVEDAWWAAYDSVDDSFDFFAGPYLAYDPEGVALLETEFMRLANAQWRYLRFDEPVPTGSLETLAIQSAGRLYLQVALTDQPAGASTLMVRARVSQPGRPELTSTTILKRDRLAPLVLPEGVAPGRGILGGEVILAAADLDPWQPLTLTLETMEGAVLARFTWDLSLLW